MRRSRRSLWLMLAVMALSLGLLRLTTPSCGLIGSSSLPTDARLSAVGSNRAADRHAHFWQKQCLVACRMLIGSPQRIADQYRHFSELIVGRRTDVAELLTALAESVRRGQISHDGCDRPLAGSQDSPAAISLIVVIRIEQHASVPYRTGWSGCNAYACGCDHFGRVIADGGVSAGGHLRRALLSRLGRLVGLATSAADEAVRTVQGSTRRMDRLAKTRCEPF